MSDLLVKLYDLRLPGEALAQLDAGGVFIRRPIAPERSLVIDWVKSHFNSRWADEVRLAFAGQPITCFVAQSNNDNNLVGFACYHTTFKGFFGPTGVAEDMRGKGIGTALLLHALHAIRNDGFAYAVIGQASSDKFYQKTVGAIPIPDSTPGAYAGRIPFEP
jgi:ribosomal protein S18 acetylase RimI-like enzyme